MLTLTRKVGEVLQIGDDIRIVIKAIQKNQVKISILAPREIRILREEVLDSLQPESETQGKP